MAMDALHHAAKHSKIMKFFLGGFIFLAVGGLVFTDVRGYFSGGLNNTTVATVGETKIDLREFDANLQPFLAQTGMSASEAYASGLVQAFLSQSIQQLILDQAGQKLDLQMGNNAIAQKLRGILGDMPREQIEMTLRAQGLSEQAVISQIRSEFTRQILASMPASLGTSTPNAVRSAFAKLNSEKRSGTIYTIPAKTLADTKTITDEDIERYYTTHTAEFTLPEKREFFVGEMTSDNVKSTLPSLTNSDIRAEYDANPDDFMTPEKRTIEQIVLKNPDDAQAVYEQAMNGTPLKEALQSVTGDTKGYTTPAAYEESGLLDVLAEKAFGPNITENDVIPPVRTPLGTVIMKITTITPAKLRLFEDVQKDLGQHMRDTAVYDALYEKMTTTEDMIDNGADFKAVVEAIGLRTTTTKAITRETLLTDEDGDKVLQQLAERSPSFVDELFSLPEGGSVYPIEVDDNRFVVIGIKTIHPETVEPLDNVKDDIRAGIEAEQQTESATVALQELVASLNNGSNVDDALKSTYKAQVTPFKNVGRNDTRKDKDLIFEGASGRYFGTLQDESAKIIYVSDVAFDADATLNETELTTLQDNYLNIVSGLLMNHYQSNTKINVNDALLNRTYGGQTTE